MRIKRPNWPKLKPSSSGCWLNSFLEDVKPEEITDDGELFGDGLGLDSLDAVEIVVLLQRNFGLEVKDMEQSREVFRTVNSLAEYVYSKTAA